MKQQAVNLPHRCRAGRAPVLRWACATLGTAWMCASAQGATRLEHAWREAPPGALGVSTSQRSRPWDAHDTWAEAARSSQPHLRERLRFAHTRVIGPRAITSVPGSGPDLASEQGLSMLSAPAERGDSGLGAANSPLRVARPVPESEALRSLVQADPRALGALSIGRPDAGALFGAMPMPAGPLWRIRDASGAWATAETVEFVSKAIETVEARHPGSPPILIGDISRPAGGPIGRHRSHESGRDVDIGWYFKDGAAQNMRLATARDLDLDRCWALVRALVTETDVERIFMDRSVQKILFQHALARHENREWLASLFQYPCGRREALIQHERRHKSHLHARFFNRRAQEWGRAAYPLLVDAGLAPPPLTVHRARRGDTISTLAQRYGSTPAAIRQANGLRSSALRAGQRYRIPIRLGAVTEMPPVVVPPRRLPPGEALALTGAPTREGTVASQDHSSAASPGGTY